MFVEELRNFTLYSLDFGVKIRQIASIDVLESDVRNDQIPSTLRPSQNYVDPSQYQIKFGVGDAADTLG